MNFRCVRSRVLITSHSDLSIIARRNMIEIEWRYLQLQSLLKNKTIVFSLLVALCTGAYFDAFFFLRRQCCRPSRTLLHSSTLSRRSNDTKKQDPLKFYSVDMTKGEIGSMGRPGKCEVMWVSLSFWRREENDVKHIVSVVRRAIDRTGRRATQTLKS